MKGAHKILLAGSIIIIVAFFLWYSNTAGIASRLGLEGKMPAGASGL